MLNRIKGLKHKTSKTNHKTKKVKSSHLYLYSTFNNTNCVKATAQYQNRKIVCQCKMTRLNTQFSVKGISLLNSVMHRAAQFSSKSICSIKSTISLEMKCPQLSKPEATAAMNQNSIGDRTEKKPWEKPGLVGGPFLLWPDEPAVKFQLLHSQIVRAQLVPVVFSRWL